MSNTPTNDNTALAAEKPAFVVTQDNAHEFCQALGLGEPLVMGCAPPMEWYAIKPAAAPAAAPPAEK